MSKPDYNISMKYNGKTNTRDKMSAKVNKGYEDTRTKQKKFLVQILRKFEVLN